MYFCWLESGMISVGYKVLLNRKLLSTKVGFVLSLPDCSEACILGPIGDNTGEALPTECVMVRITYLSHDLSTLISMWFFFYDLFFYGVHWNFNLPELLLSYLDVHICADNLSGDTAVASEDEPHHPDHLMCCWTLICFHHHLHPGTFLPNTRGLPVLPSLLGGSLQQLLL